MAKRMLIVGVSSDIGLSVAEHYLNLGWSVCGTFRTMNSDLGALHPKLSKLYFCDLSDVASINSCVASMLNDGVVWDALIICPGTMLPLGDFLSCEEDSWCNSVIVNFLSPARFLHGLLPLRCMSQLDKSSVILFAGGGTNSAPEGVSAYTVSKIALIKLVELLDKEIDGVTFTIVGPGWVKTKIHNEVFESDLTKKAMIEETQRRLESDDFNEMKNVVACCNWVIESQANIVGGRNFSVVHDDWGSQSLDSALVCDEDMFKLRRKGNQ